MARWKRRGAHARAHARTCRDAAPREAEPNIEGPLTPQLHPAADAGLDDSAEESPRGGEPPARPEREPCRRRWITRPEVVVFARQGPKAPGNRGAGQFTEGSLSAET